MTAKDGEYDEAEGLDTGADDYLVKPFSFPVLLARLRALSRRATSEAPVPVSVGDLRLDAGSASRVWRGDVEVQLTARQFDVLEFLVRRAGQVQSKVDILAGVWPHDFDGDPNIVEVYIGRLRRLVDEPFGRRSLETGARGRLSCRRRRGGRVRFRSMRFRITALATLIAAVVLTACAVIVVAVVEQQLEDNLDHSLAQRADQVEAATFIDPGTALANTNQEDRFVQVLDADGGVLFASDNLAGRPAVVEPPPGEQMVSTHSDIPIEDDLYRVLVRRYSVDGIDRFVVVGENVDDVSDAVNALIAVLAVTMPTAVAVLAFAVWWLVGRTLRPVEEIRREVASIGLDRPSPARPGARNR